MSKNIFIFFIFVCVMSCQSTSQLNNESIEAQRINNENQDEPRADARGIISYDNYQVFVSNGEETINTIALRLRLNAERFALYNGLIPSYKPRKGELLALHERVDSQHAKKLNDWSETSTKTILKKASSSVSSKVNIPSDAIKHRVESGETAYSIARLYKVSVTSLAKWNELDPEFTIYPGRELIIPAISLKAKVSKVNKISKEIKKEVIKVKPSTIPQKYTQSNSLQDQKLLKQPAFILPLKGIIVKKYNTSSSSEGIDIEASAGSQVFASSNGTVALITDGTNKIGKIILIKHKNNIISLYAGVKEVQVKKNQIVSLGQKLGYLMGVADTNKLPTLHFEIRNGTKSVNPELYFN